MQGQSCLTVNDADNVADNLPQWFVMRFLYNDQPKIRLQIENDGIETFFPSRPVVKIRNGRRVREWEPVIRDLYFVHATRPQLDPYVVRHANFQYRYKTGGRYKEPLVVPDRQMNYFIAAVKSSANPLYFTPQELDADKGTPVRIIGGNMDGYEGILLKVKGARARRLIVEIPNTLSAAVEVTADLIEVLQ